jgi:hypothetical protein
MNGWEIIYQQMKEISHEWKDFTNNDGKLSHEWLENNLTNGRKIPTNDGNYPTNGWKR